MSRQFSIPTVLRMVPNSLLKGFFQEIVGSDFDIPWSLLGQREVEPILKAICDLPNGLQDRIADALRTVFDMACESGIDAIAEVADRLDEIQIVNLMPEHANFYAKAMWYWLARPESFGRAVRVHEVNQIHWWRKRNDLPCIEPHISSATISRLQQDISNMLLWSQGRGQICTIETMERNAIDYFFVYPDDFVQSITAHDEDGVLAPQTIRPTFNIVFAYCRSEGTLELYAKVPAKMRT